MKLYISMLNALQDQRGAAMPEYGLLVALIAVVAAVTAATLGDNLALLFTDVATDIAP